MMKGNKGVSLAFVVIITIVLGLLVLGVYLGFNNESMNYLDFIFNTSESLTDEDSDFIDGSYEKGSSFEATEDKFERTSDNSVLTKIPNS